MFYSKEIDIENIPSPGQTDINGFRWPSVRVNLHDNTRDVRKITVNDDCNRRLYTYKQLK